MTQTDTARVFAIPPGHGLINALAEGLCDPAWRAQLAGAPTPLHETLVVLPTRRAVDALTRALAAKLAATTQLVRITTIADAPLDEAQDDATLAAMDAALPKAIAPLTRELLLARLAQAKPERPSPRAALAMARSLTTLLDETQIQRVSLDSLDAILANDTHFAEHWQRSLAFLDGLRRGWTGLLAARKETDPMARRDATLRALAQRWRDCPPAALTILAGSTGATPGGADVIAAVASLPTGAVVLEDLDLAMDDGAWRGILTASSHPQHNFARLLARVNLERRAVAPWHNLRATNLGRARATMLRAAFAPPDSDSDRLHAAASRAARAKGWDGLTLLEAESPQDEARLVALALRQALDAPEATAALITPDASLALRVRAELARWHIRPDDSGGALLARTRAFAFLALIAQAARVSHPSGADADALFAVLAHPLARLGRNNHDLAAEVRQSERLARDSYSPQTDAPVLREARAALAPLLALHGAPACSARDYAEALEACALALAHDPQDPNATPWQRWDGRECQRLLADMRAAQDVLHARANDWRDLLNDLAGERRCWPPTNPNARCAIWGPLEARLMRRDFIVLAGLNEGVWPRRAQPGPWLNRAMREAMGLDPPERGIGLAAHDVTALLTAPKALLTRAKRDATSFSVPSRFFARLRGVRDAFVAQAAQDPFAWRDALDAPALVPKPAPAPAPSPPLALRPKRFSPSGLALFAQDPYAFYAQQVLRLRPLAPRAPAPDARAFGLCVHAALDALVYAMPQPRAHPSEAHDRLTQAFDEEVAATGLGATHPFFVGVWRERFAQAAAAMVATFPAPDWRSIAEIEVRAPWPTPDVHDVQTRARIDRVDIDPQGHATITDYKTGVPPTHKAMREGSDIQLALAALIAQRGGFAEVAKTIRIQRIQYIKTPDRLLGAKIVALDGNALADALALAQDTISTRIAAALRDPMPPGSDPHPDYWRLARVQAPDLQPDETNL